MDETTHAEQKANLETKLQQEQQSLKNILSEMTAEYERQQQAALGEKYEELDRNSMKLGELERDLASAAREVAYVKRKLAELQQEREEEESKG